MVVSEELLLLEDERDRDGVEVREAILSGFGWKRLLINSVVGLRSDITVRQTMGVVVIVPCCTRLAKVGTDVSGPYHGRND